MSSNNHFAEISAAAGDITVEDLVPFSLSWADLLAVVGVLILGWILSRWARRGVESAVRKVPRISQNLSQIAGRATGYIVILLSLGIGLALLGANVQPLLAIVVVVGVVIALVLRGVSDNFAGGVVIQARQTVRIGDEIQINGIDEAIIGTVIELNARSVLLRKPDGVIAHVPNSKLLSDVFLNRTAHGHLRSSLQIQVTGQAHQIDTLEEILLDIVKSSEGVFLSPSPTVRFDLVSATWATVTIYLWHQPDEKVTVLNRAMKAIVAATQHEGLRVTASVR